MSMANLLVVAVLLATLVPGAALGAFAPQNPMEQAEGPSPWGAAGVPPSSLTLQPPDGYWRVELVDGNGDVGYSPSLALDLQGRPHISYCDRTNYDLKYAWHDGTAWQVETVDSEGKLCLEAETYLTSLVLDGAGRPHVTYYEAAPHASLKYARRDGTNWLITRVDDSGWAGKYASLVLDQQERQRISYHYQRPSGGGAGYGEVRYASFDGGAWRIETLESGTYETGWDTSLALDGLGLPRISYGRQYGLLRYAQFDGAIWQIETVDGSQGLGSSLVLDSEGRPHISYQGFEGLKYAWYDGAAWHVEMVDGAQPMMMGPGGPTSLALDRAGRPHIGYSNTHNYGLGIQYAWHDGQGWQLSTVDAGGYRYLSLVLDAADQPHIAYYHEAQRALLYGRWMPYGPYLDKRAEPTSGLQQGDPLTYTLTLRASPGLNLRLWDPLPEGVTYVSGSLTSALTPTAVYSPAVRAVVWQGSLPAGDEASIRFRVTGGGSVTQAFALLDPIVNTAWLTDTDRGIVASDIAIVNGWSVYLPLITR